MVASKSVAVQSSDENGHGSQECKETHMSSLKVTIAGERFDHLLYHFVLTHSNWEYVMVCFAENFANLSTGMQNAYWELGGAPAHHRTDRLTLAVNADGQPEQFTARYQGLLDLYGVKGEATNAASGHGMAPK
jgi:hypothetical protein